MKSVKFIFIALLFYSCTSEHTEKLSTNDSLEILNTALADRTFLQEQLSHKKNDTIYFVKGRFMPQNVKLEEKYFKFIYIDSTAINVRESRSFYERDPRVRIGIEKFHLKQDTVSLTIMNYGAKFYYAFKFEKKGQNWNLVKTSYDTGY